MLEAGRPVGIQEVLAKHFPVARTVETGSWLTQSAQGRGIGMEMRAAALHLAFDGLRAAEAISSSYADNPRSEAVSRKAGYSPNGSNVVVREQQAARLNRWVLTSEAWTANRRVDIAIIGLEPCLPLLDAVPSEQPSADSRASAVNVADDALAS